MHIRDPEEILHLFDVSYVQKIVDFFQKNSLSPRAHTSFKTLKIHKKNYKITFSRNWYSDVSKGALSDGIKKLCTKLDRGGEGGLVFLEGVITLGRFPPAG